MQRLPVVVSLLCITLLCMDMNKLKGGADPVMISIAVSSAVVSFLIATAPSPKK